MSTANYSDPLSRPAAVDAWAGNLTHDLRQSLSTIQSAVCYLRLILRENSRALAYLDIIEQGVFESEEVLAAALAAVPAGPVQPAGLTGEGNFDLTNAATADVT